MMPTDTYLQIAWPDRDAYKAMRCACCGGRPEAWQYITDKGEVQRVVMCETMDLERDGDGPVVGGGCPYSMPPTRFYCGTLRQAVVIWNLMNGLLLAKQADNALPPTASA